MVNAISLAIATITTVCIRSAPQRIATIYLASMHHRNSENAARERRTIELAPLRAPSSHHDRAQDLPKRRPTVSCTGIRTAPLIRFAGETERSVRDQNARQLRGGPNVDRVRKIGGIIQRTSLDRAERRPGRGGMPEPGTTIRAEPASQPVPGIRVAHPAPRLAGPHVNRLAPHDARDPERRRGLPPAFGAMADIECLPSIEECIANPTTLTSASYRKRHLLTP